MLGAAAKVGIAATGASRRRRQENGRIHLAFSPSSDSFGFYPPNDVSLYRVDGFVSFISKTSLAVFTVAALTASIQLPAGAEDAPPSGHSSRIALVIGNAAYPDHGLATTANDAGLVAQTLQAAGF